MNSVWMKRFRYVVALGVLSGLYGVENLQRPVAAAEAHSLDGNCDEECGPSVSCDQGCWSYADQLPSFHTICGEYGGSPWNGYGNCIGTCGDGYCNPYNEEDDSTCYEDCGECGDNTCTSGAEDASHCYADCGSCSDSVCSPSEVCGGANQCATDCGSCASYGSECTELYSDCGGGEKCNGQHYCVTPGDKSCMGDHGCCSNEIWFEMDCAWVFINEGYAAGIDCEERHCDQYGQNCGECIPYGPPPQTRQK